MPDTPDISWCHCFLQYRHDFRLEQNSGLDIARSSCPRSSPRSSKHTILTRESSISCASPRARHLLVPASPFPMIASAIILSTWQHEVCWEGYAQTQTHTQRTHARTHVPTHARTDPHPHPAFPTCILSHNHTDKREHTHEITHAQTAHFVYGRKKPPVKEMQQPLIAGMNRSSFAYIFVVHRDKMRHSRNT